MLLLGVTLDYVLIDAGLALVGLTLGFFVGGWYVRSTTSSEQNARTDDQQKQQDDQEANEAERAKMAAFQLRDLAQNVALDVVDHNTLVTAISDRLESLDHQSADSGAAVAEAVGTIVKANEKLQDRLSDAEKKIQSQAEEIQAQEFEARTDALTNLANRRAFDDVLAENHAAFVARQQPFSLLMFDVDHFKKFNDTHGHQAGDEVLRSVAQTMLRSSKVSGTSCRYGGEEFVLVMPNTRIKEARDAAERVRKAIEAAEVKFEGKTLRVTASMGVAEIAENENAAQLVRRSDHAVYAAKKADRNCTYWNDGQQCLSIDTLVAPIDDPVSQNRSKNQGPSELFNRGDFGCELQRRVTEGHHFGVPLSLMSLRIVDFEKLSQEYGQAVSKLLVASVAQYVRGTLRDIDLLAQLEGGSFMVMLPGSSGKGARHIGDRVATAIASCVIPLGAGNNIRLEVIHGVTELHPDDDAKRMMVRAEQVVDEERLVAQPASVG